MRGGGLTPISYNTFDGVLTSSIQGGLDFSNSTATYTTGINRQCIEVGSNQIVDNKSNFNLGTLSEWTVSLQYKASGTLSAEKPILCHYYPSSYVSFSITVLNSSHLMLEFRDSNISSIRESIEVGNNVLTDGNWHHIAVCWNGTNMLVYFDEINKGSISIPGIYYDANSSVVTNINKWGSAGTTFGGTMYIDELKIYDRCIY